MNELAMLLGVAAVGLGLARCFHLPAIPLLLGLGMVLSFTGMAAPSANEHGTQSDLLSHALELGLAFLVFSSGMELNPTRVGSHKKAAVIVGIGQFTLAGLVGYFASKQLGFTPLESAYLGLALSASSTLVVVAHLKSQRQMSEPFGRLVIGVLLVQDILMILVIAGLAQSSRGIGSVMTSLATTSLLAGLAIILQKWAFPKLVVQGKLDEETLLMGVLAILFGFVGGAKWLNLPPILGAFFAGLSLSSFPVNGLVRGLINPMHDFFTAIFFSALGAIVKPPDVETAWFAIILCLVVILLTPPLVAVLAEIAGATSRSAIESGLILAQASEFSLVLALVGKELGHLDETIFTIVAMVTAGTMCTTPFLANPTITHRLLAVHPLRNRLKTIKTTTNHILILGFGSAGMWVLKPLKEAGHDILVVDEDPNVISKLEKMNIPCIHGDAGDVGILEAAGLDRAKLVIASLGRTPDIIKIMPLAQHCPVVARVFEQNDADSIAKIGGTAILNSTASLDTFLTWYKTFVTRR